jgi:hypothetical protein
LREGADKLVATKVRTQLVPTNSYSETHALRTPEREGAALPRNTAHADGGEKANEQKIRTLLALPDNKPGDVAKQLHIPVEEVLRVKTVDTR